MGEYRMGVQNGGGGGGNHDIATVRGKAMLRDSGNSEGEKKPYMNVESRKEGVGVLTTKNPTFHSLK